MNTELDRFRLQLQASLNEIGHALQRMPISSLAVCIVAILAVSFTCSVRFGSSGSATFGDLALAGFAEVGTAIILSSPVDVAHLHGYPLAQWCAALGTVVAILGILLSHSLRRP